MKNQKGVSSIKIIFIAILIAIVIYFLVTKILERKVERMQAEMDAKFHTIYFDTAGGKPIDPKRAQYFASISNIRAEKEGYIFIGWLLNGQPIEYSFESLTQDVTLTASYREKSDNSISSNTSVSSSNTNISSNSSNAQTQVENKKTYNINVRKVQQDNLGVELCALTVMNYQTETYNSEVGKVEEGQEWVIVNMKFENMSDSTIVIDKSDFKIVDGAGRYGYRPSYKHLDTELDMIEIRAGQTARFSVRFVYYKNNEMILRFNHPSIVTEVYTDIKLR